MLAVAYAYLKLLLLSNKEHLQCYSANHVIYMFWHCAS